MHCGLHCGLHCGQTLVFAAVERVDVERELVAVERHQGAAVERELVGVERVDVERHQGAAVDVERELVAVELMGVDVERVTVGDYG